MGLKLSSVSDAMRKLAAEGLVNHAPYTPVTLTALGERHAVDMVRRHRLIETFLVETLGYEWDEVHAEAENLEHAVSDLMIQRMDAFLGHPSRDPHGDPIRRLTAPSPNLMPGCCTNLRQARAWWSNASQTTTPPCCSTLPAKTSAWAANFSCASRNPFSDTVNFTSGTQPVSLGHWAAGKIWVRQL